MGGPYSNPSEGMPHRSKFAPTAKTLCVTVSHRGHCPRPIMAMNGATQRWWKRWPHTRGGGATSAWSPAELPELSIGVKHASQTRAAPRSKKQSGRMRVAASFAVSLTPRTMRPLKKATHLYTHHWLGSCRKSASSEHSASMATSLRSRRPKKYTSSSLKKQLPIFKKH